jgi:hypothetical protein
MRGEQYWAGTGQEAPEGMFAAPALSQAITFCVGNTETHRTTEKISRQ